jgi:hypothetical protein
LRLSARVVLSRHIKAEGGGYENTKRSRHIGIGDIETHTDRPRYFWGIGSRLGHPSKY